MDFLQTPDTISMTVANRVPVHTRWGEDGGTITIGFSPSTNRWVTYCDYEGKHFVYTHAVFAALMAYLHPDVDNEQARLILDLADEPLVQCEIPLEQEAEERLWLERFA
jgi:hypothetical protein